MWIRRTVPETAEARDRRCREDVWHSALFGLFGAVLVTFIHGWKEANRTGLFLVPFDEIVRRLPYALLSGILVAVAYYWIESREKTYVCITCGAVKSKHDPTNCACGGTFENILRLRWVDDPLAASAKEPSYETIKCFNYHVIIFKYALPE